MQRQYGFTLIELMIVVAVVGVLTVIALPEYKNYQVCAKISAGLVFTGSCKNAFTEFAQIGNSRWPQDAPYHLITIGCGEPRTANRDEAMKAPPPMQHIKVVTVRAHGLIAVRFNIPEIDGK